MKPKRHPLLPRLTNEQNDRIVAMARESGVPVTQCPTCLSSRLDVDEGNYGWVNGTYRLDGVEHPCDCETQMILREHYYAANIGDQYQRLNWDDYYGSPEAKENVAIYLSKWESAKINGMGLEFAGPNLGVGKTFAATHIGKELVKRGESVFFIPFLEVVRLFEEEDRANKEARLKNTTVLILDEVIPASTAAMRNLFSSKFEELVRHRTNFNKPTIMTTNLTQDMLHEEYPRSYSLLAAKQIRTEMNGVDARKGDRAMRNIELFLNDEIEPIT